MNSGQQVVERIEAAGGELTIHGERIKCRLPEDAIHLLEELRAHRREALHVLRKREAVLAMPSGVELVSWQPKEPPVVVERWAVVTDVPLFIRCTLRQLEYSLSGRFWLAGHRSPRELQDDLEQCGCVVRFVEDVAG